MKTGCYSYCFLLLLILSNLFRYASAQQAVVTTGSDFQSNTGTISYSVGQTFFSHHQGINEKLTEGIQQPFEILIISSTKAYSHITLDCNVFPNPTTKYLYLNIRHNIPLNLEYRLISQTGALLQSERIDNKKTTIEMSQYISGIYVLHILDQYKTVKSFQIIKH